MATDTKLDSLVINYLSQSQYNNAKSSGTLNANQIYMTPASSSTYTLPAATSSTLGGVKLSDSTSSTSSTSGGIAATPAAVKAAIAEAKLAAWPIGSIYMSVNSTSPANLFGGTWERISDTFLFAASSSYPAGSTGGEFTHKLTQSELPNYSLSVANGSNVIRSKTGSYADAYVQTQSSGWGIPNWESKTVTVASGGPGQPTTTCRLIYRYGYGRGQNKEDKDAAEEWRSMFWVAIGAACDYSWLEI